MSYSSGDDSKSDGQRDQELLIVTVISCVDAALLLTCFLVSYCVLWRYCRKKKPTEAVDSGEERSSESKEDEELGGASRSRTGTLLLPRQKGRREWMNLNLSVPNRKGLKKVSREEMVNFSPKQRLKMMELPHSKICLLGEICETNFGKVYRGEASNLIENEVSTAVLVKSLKKLADPVLDQDFCIEMVWASGFDHPNILNLLAVCTTEEPKYLIYEYMEFGSLTVFLQSTALVWLEMDLQSRASFGSFVDGDAKNPHMQQLVGIEELIAIATQVADALEYISSKRLVLRDIGARNCHVGKGLKVKIAEFGLSYDLHSKEYGRLRDKDSRPVPVRWMAPEAICRGSYSMYSDIWSYGVLLWEVFSLGEKPYGNLTPAQAAECIIRHETLPRPKHCPEGIFRAMEDCWLTEPVERKSFGELKEELDRCLTMLDEDTPSKRVTIMRP